jgi:hypothetical protein
MNNTKNCFKKDKKRLNCQLFKCKIPQDLIDKLLFYEKKGMLLINNMGTSCTAHI